MGRGLKTAFSHYFFHSGGLDNQNVAPNQLIILTDVSEKSQLSLYGGRPWRPGQENSVSR